MIVISTVLLFLTGFFIHSSLAIYLFHFQDVWGDVYVQRCCGRLAALAIMDYFELIDGLIEFPDIRSLRHDWFFSSSC